MKSKAFIFVVFFIVFLITTTFISCTRSMQPDKIEIPPGVKAGFIKNPNHKNYTLRLMDQNSGKRLEVKTTDKTVKLLPGKYKVAAIRVEKKDAEGVSWFAISVPEVVLEVREGETYEYEFGEPFEVKVKKSGNVYNYFLYGNSGEKCSYVYSKKIGPIDPAYRIVGPDGKTLQSGNFHYT